MVGQKIEPEPYGYGKAGFTMDILTVYERYVNRDKMKAKGSVEEEIRNGYIT